ncbi:hypothetical protein LXA43DRAFT_304558 [Ganoderma leucocontextum]|nr:hypothetical protein LXA43DRAFT_304558 [Ganoderma leucocontextum]
MQCYLNRLCRYSSRRGTPVCVGRRSGGVMPTGKYILVTEQMGNANHFHAIARDPPTGGATIQKSSTSTPRIGTECSLRSSPTGIPKQASGDLRWSGFSIWTRCVVDRVRRSLDSLIGHLRSHSAVAFSSSFDVSTYCFATFSQVSYFPVFHRDRQGRLSGLPATSISLTLARLTTPLPPVSSAAVEKPRRRRSAQRFAHLRRPFVENGGDASTKMLKKKFSVAPKTPRRCAFNRRTRPLQNF